MPCDLGYKNVSRVVIPAPQPLSFSSRTEAPQVDAELLALIGQEDDAFIEWLHELDNGPLLEAALAKALKAAGPVGPLRFSIENGGLSAKATFRGEDKRAGIERLADMVGRRFQIEVLAIVAQLLDFETQVSASGETLVFEGEKHGSNQVHEYLRVTLDEKSGSTLMFEHFSSKKEAALAKAKFLALAQKLGVRIDVVDSKESGSPIPGGSVHKHFLKNK